MPPRRSALATATVALALFLGTHSAMAQGVPSQLSNQPDPNMAGGVTLRAQGTESAMYETNPLMQTTSAKSLWGSVTSPELIFNDNTPLSHLGADLLVNENIFNQSSFDSTDVHFKGGINTTNSNWSAGLQQTTDYDTTRTSEVSDFNFNVAPVRHLGYSFTPNVGYKPSTVDSINLQGSVQESHYDSSVFTDYQVVSINPTYAHIFDPRNTGTFGIQAQRYETTVGPRNTDDTIGPTIGWTSVLTPRLTATANIGMQEARQFTATTSQNWTPQFTFSADLAFKGQQDLTHFTAARQQYPYGNGTEALQTSFGITDTHILNDVLSLNVGGNYMTSDYQTSALGNMDTFITGTGGIAYHMTPHFDLTGNYQYRRETLTGTSSTADDHTVLFGVSYHPQAWSL
ncbi:MAG TPA: hypothetical protein VFR09_05600 [Alphaproteobacteria bacterium]|nr:hypothetical protein [Alphaproteobacteria bacterium]